MGADHAARCPRCGSEGATHRGGRLWFIVAVALLAGVALLITGFAEGWGWVTIAGLVGAAVVVALNVLAAVVASCKCGKCGHVWR